MQTIPLSQLVKKTVVEQLLVYSAGLKQGVRTLSSHRTIVLHTINYEVHFVLLLLVDMANGLLAK